MRTPVLFRNDTALTWDGGRRMLWPATCGDQRVWLYRWPTTPLHIVEIIAKTKLRDVLRIEDGDSLSFHVSPADIDTISWTSWFSWAALWGQRELWFYSRDDYKLRVEQMSFSWRTVQGTRATNRTKT